MGDVFAMEIWSLTFLVFASGSASKFVDGMATVGEKFEANHTITRESSEISKKSMIERIPYLEDLKHTNAINDRFAMVEKRLAAMEKNCKCEQKPIPTDPLVDPITGLKWSEILDGCVAPKDANGWTLLQQRDVRAKNVFGTKRWNDYKNGFQESGNAYWLGLQEMHEKTSRGKWNVALVYHCEGKIKCVVNEDFRVDSEITNFKLHLGPEIKHKGFDYKDRTFSYSNNMAFSTIDRDNDKSGHCAKQFNGGWWHKSCYQLCPNCDNLNIHCSARSRIYMAMKNVKGVQ